MRLVIVDIGLVNLGLVEMEVTSEFEVNQVLFADRLDITILKHNVVPREQCRLYHTADAVDRVHHFLQEYAAYFKRADYVLLERQPIGGLVHVEQLLYDAFREKTVLCSPVKMHRYFNLPKKDYEKRKERTTEIAKRYLETLDVWKQCSDRLHDVADAVCIGMWWLSVKREAYLQEQRKADHSKIHFNGNIMTVDSFFDQFRYKPTINKKN